MSYDKRDPILLKVHSKALAASISGIKLSLPGNAGIFLARNLYQFFCQDIDSFIPFIILKEEVTV